MLRGVGEGGGGGGAGGGGPGRCCSCSIPNPSPTVSFGVCNYIHVTDLTSLTSRFQNFDQ